MAGPACDENTHSTVLSEGKWRAVPLVPYTDWRDVAQEAAVLVHSAENAHAEEEVGVLDGVGDEAQLQQGDVLQGPRHWQLPGVHRAQSQAVDERRHACLCLRVVTGDEHVQWATLGWAGRQNMGEQGVERLDDMRAGGSGLGDLLRAGTAVGGDKALEIGRNRVGDVDDNLAA